MMNHGFSVCGIYNTWPAAVVFDAGDTTAAGPWLPKRDLCGTRWWPKYLDARIRGLGESWWRARPHYLEWRLNNMCRDMACSYCAASGR